MNYQEKRNVKKRGISKSDRDKNAVVPMSKTEGLRHFLTKAIIFWHLYQKDHDIYTEAKIKNNSKIDIIDFTTKELVEIETTHSLEKSRKNEEKLTPEWRGLKQIQAIDICPELDKQIKDIIGELE